MKHIDKCVCKGLKKTKGATGSLGFALIALCIHIPMHRTDGLLSCCIQNQL